MDPASSSDLEQRLDAWSAALPAAESSALQDGICRKLSASLAPVKPLPPPWRLARPFLAIFFVGAGALIAVLDKTGFHLMTATQIAAMAVIFSLAAAFFAFSLASKIIPAARVLPLAPLLLISGAAFAALALLFPWHSGAGFTSPKFLQEGWPCSVLVIVVAAPSAGLFYLAARRGALFPSASPGAVIGGLATILGLAAAQFQCMFPQARHLLIWHGGAAAIFIGASAFLGALLQRRPN